MRVAQIAGGPNIPLKFGRKDTENPEGCAPEGNLPAGGAPWPAPAKGPGDHLRHVFYRMGFNDQEIVALSGARQPPTLRRSVHPIVRSLWSRCLTRFLKVLQAI